MFGLSSCRPVLKETRTITIYEDGPRTKELEAALRAVRSDIIEQSECVLWRRSIPSETTVDFIDNVLGDEFCEKRKL